MTIGNEQSAFRENMREMINRKNADRGEMRFTRGGEELHNLLHSQLHRMKDVQLPAVQNPDGTFNPLKGWDLPQDQ